MGLRGTANRKCQGWWWFRVLRITWVSRKVVLYERPGSGENSSVVCEEKECGGCGRRWRVSTL